MVDRVQSIVELILQVADETRRGTQSFRRNTGQAATSAENLNEELQESNQNLRRFDRSARTSAQAAGRLTDQVANAAFAMRLAGRQLIQLAAVPTVFGAAAIKSAADFSVQIAEIGTLVDETVQSNQQLATSVIELSSAFGVGRAEVAAGLYSAISSGATAGAEASNLLDVALRTSIGGVTDVRTAVTGITSVLNAFNLEFSEAESVADTLFATMRGGQTTIQELSSFLFQAAPIAANLGVQFNELAAAIQAITLQGTPTQTAAVGIRTALTALLQSDDVSEFFRELGFESTQAAIEAQGLQTTLNQLTEAAGNTAGGLLEFVNSAVAAQTIIQLTGENTERFNEALQSVNNSTGDLNEAYEEVNETLGRRLSRTITNISNTFLLFGQSLEPLAISIIDFVNNSALGIQSLINLLGDFSPTIATVILSVTSLITVIGTLIVVIGALAPGWRILTGVIGIYATELAGATAATGAFSVATGALTAALTGLRTVVLSLLSVGGVATAIIGVGGFVILNRLNTEINRLNTEIDQIGEGLRRRNAISEAFGAAEEQLNALNLLTEDRRRELLLLEAEAVSAQSEIERLQADAETITGGDAMLQQQLQDAIAFRQAVIEGNIESVQGFIEEFESTTERRNQIQTRLRNLERQGEEQLQQDILQARERTLNESIQGRQRLLSELRQAASREEAAERTALERISQLNEQITARELSTENEIRDIKRSQLAETLQQTDIEAEAAGTLRDVRRDIANIETEEQAQANRALLERVEAINRSLADEEKRIGILQEVSRLNTQIDQAEVGIQQARVERAQEIQTAAASSIASIEEDIVTLRDLIDTLDEEPVEIEADIRQALAALAEVEAEIERLNNSTVTVNVRTVEANATGGLAGRFAGRFANGGKLPGFGGGDKVRALLEAGEFIVNKNRTAMFRPILEAINSGSANQVSALMSNFALPRFQDGGVVAADTPSASLGVTQESVRLELNVGGREFNLFGASDEVTGLVDSLRELNVGAG